MVATNSVCQGQHVPLLWPALFERKAEIQFAHTSFKWANLASLNAGVTVVIVGLGLASTKPKWLFTTDGQGVSEKKCVGHINAYLLPAENIEVQQRSEPLSAVAKMRFGNHPYYGSALIFTKSEARKMVAVEPAIERYLRRFYGSDEFVNGTARDCLWISDTEQSQARAIEIIDKRVRLVEVSRTAAKKDSAAQDLAKTPHRFREQFAGVHHTILVPRVSSENRPYLPIGIVDSRSVVQEKAFAMYDAPLWNMALIASRLHWVWIGTVCVRLEMRFSYSNTLGWNTFPVPTLTEQNKVDLTRCAESILLSRESHFPATIADLYDPETMPANLRAAHEANDETLERIYIGRRFKNDTERLEKLFEMYTKMTSQGTGIREQGTARKPKKQVRV